MSASTANHARKLRKAARVILVGPPGAGKGTQSGRLLEHFRLSAISSGDILRENIRNRTPLGMQAESVMRGGGLINDAVMVKLIVGELSKRGWVESRPTTTSGITVTGALEIMGHTSAAKTARLAASNCPSSSFLLDGFPRTVTQAESLDKEVDMNFVVNLNVPRDVILDRIANRMVHEPSGRVYNNTWNPPQVPGYDDVTGEKLTKRADDCPETFAKRLKSYDKSTAPLLEYYDKTGLLWTVSGKSSDEITPQLDAEIFRRFG
ncbi:P-loop containing nucleoside triphosphate hydrolase protein [Tricharina praecox]|uniref:P-loop containing nucleoside triphosphate hydrolase protein n=1 Tax=Tricharina praecox TaxID=43433 RepID=UPI00221FEFE3|nr:P-loop containing nucleoside triphosphate hydrolase protein [Tricharina praecox]KAI5847013.1 P-loop containing nucleoside triphosphate hydrolase protein [Tricharina praecox]